MQYDSTLKDTLVVRGRGKQTCSQALDRMHSNMQGKCLTISIHHILTPKRSQTFVKTALHIMNTEMM